MAGRSSLLRLRRLLRGCGALFCASILEMTIEDGVLKDQQAVDRYSSEPHQLRSLTPRRVNLGRGRAFAQTAKLNMSSSQSRHVPGYCESMSSSRGQPDPQSRILRCFRFVSHESRATLQLRVWPLPVPSTPRSNEQRPRIRPGQLQRLY